MFGFSLKSSNHNFNSLNPRFAEIFHSRYDAAFGKRPQVEGEQAIFKTSLRQFFVDDFANAKNASAKIGFEQALANTTACVFSLLLMQASKIEDNSPAEAFGNLYSLMPIGRVVFGSAPGLARNKSDAGVITLRMLRAMHIVCLPLQEENKYFKGAAFTCADLITAVDPEAADADELESAVDLAMQIRNQIMAFAKAS